MSDQKAQEDFLNTPDASEYLQKLQVGRIDLPAEANALEREMFSQLQELQKKVRGLSVEAGDLEKEILVAQARQKVIARDIDLVSGEMTGYAKMLLSAEGARREAVELAKAEELAKAKPVDEDSVKAEPVDEEPEVEEVTKAELVPVDEEPEVGEEVKSSEPVPDDDTSIPTAVAI